MSQLFVVFLFSAFFSGIVHSLVCPADWVAHKASCYVFINDRSSWTGAQTICGLLRARLVEIEDAEENAFVSNLLKQKHGDRSWIGLNDFTREGTFVWTSSREVATFTNWARGEPNNSHGNQLGDQDCGTITASGVWDDEFCESAHHQQFICENKPDEAVVG